MSDLFTLDFKDFLNGLFMAVLGNIVFYLIAIFSDLYQLVMNGEHFEIVINWKAIMVIAIFSFLTYISKRLFSNSNGIILGKK